VLRHAILADHRRLQALRIADIVETKAALYAQPVLVRRALAAGDGDELVVLDVVGELAADAAVRTDAVHAAVRKLGPDIFLVDERGRHQGAGGAGLHAFAAGDAGGGAHRIVEIKHDFFVVAAPGHADHVVHLHFAAGTDAKIALDAGVEIDRHRRMRTVGRGLAMLRETARLHAHPLRPVPELGLGIVRDFLFRLVGQQQFEHHLARGFRTLRLRLDLHAFAGRADAGGGEHTLALDLDHASAAVAVRTIARLRQIAEMRNVSALALRHLPDGFALEGFDFLAVEGEFDLFRHAVHGVHGFTTGAKVL
jgi:hypothetical protein